MAVALADLQTGDHRPDLGLVVREPIPAGHKVAINNVQASFPVYKYGQIIGFAARDIAAGSHVHTHNLELKDYTRDYAYGLDARETDFVPLGERASFQGLVRDDGRVGTRNYLGVLATVNCSASVAHFMARGIPPEELARFPNVDGIVPIGHSHGCPTAVGAAELELLQRALAGYARHPNFAGIILVGLGCEYNHLEALCGNMGLEPGPLLRTLNIQDLGGTRATVARGMTWLREMLPRANQVARQTVPASHLILGLECGGSDAYSGISANPALGAAADLLIRHGGTAVLSETPEIYGAEHLLTRRAINREVGEKLVARIRWWETITAWQGGAINNNPTPGNKAGGLTTILEKSLGAIAKGGTTSLRDVAGFAEPITTKGLVFMDTPGYDPVSVTGLIAGGVNVMGFTTGRGSVFGAKPAPIFKLASNSGLFHRLPDDMDINCGSVVDGEKSVEELGRDIFALVLEIASGRKTRSEQLGFGDHEFVSWQLGTPM